MNASAAAAIPTPQLAARIVDNGDGTVTDTSTGLTWSQATLNTEEVDQHTAAQICTDLTLAGHADWRVPTIAELFTIADHTTHSPAINTDVFPDTKSDWYWSSTPCAWSSDFAWVVDFYYGDVNDDHRSNDYGFVRAVRGVSPPASQ